MQEKVPFHRGKKCMLLSIIWLLVVVSNIFCQVYTWVENMGTKHKKKSYVRLNTPYLFFFTKGREGVFRIWTESDHNRVIWKKTKVFESGNLAKGEKGDKWGLGFWHEFNYPDSTLEGNLLLLKGGLAANYQRFKTDLIPLLKRY